MKRNIKFAEPVIDTQLAMTYFKEVLDSGRYTDGEYCDKFAALFTTFLNIPDNKKPLYCLPVSSCGSALFLALWCNEIFGKHVDVIVPAMTHVATVHAVEAVGANPIFVDCTPIGNMSLHNIEQAITPRTRAIMLLHYIGIPADDQIVQFAKDNGIILIEDCALALGAKTEEGHVGTNGDVGCFSFYPAKHITTGEGGMFVTKHKEIYERAKICSRFGRISSGTHLYDVGRVGFNFRLNEFSAALGCLQMTTLEDNLTKRKHNTSVLSRELLKNKCEITSLRNTYSYSLNDSVEPACYCEVYYVGKKRDVIRKFLFSNGIETSIYYPHPVPRLEYYRKRYGYGKIKYRIAELIADHTIAIPIGPHLTDDDMIYIADKLIDAVEDTSVTFTLGNISQTFPNFGPGNETCGMSVMGDEPMFVMRKEWGGTYVRNEEGGGIMIILGIQEAHDASAALMVEGRIVAACQEERFSRLKGDYGFPKESVRFCLASQGIRPKDIDIVALASYYWNPVLVKIKRNANFDVPDWVQEQREFWKPTLLEGKQVKYYDIYKDRPDWKYDDFYPMDHLLEGYMDAAEMVEMKKIRKAAISKYLEISEDKIKFIKHEDCHRAYGYYGAGLFDEEALVLTAEGIGDYSNGTVSLMQGWNTKELANTKDNHIGHIYQYITLILGMKPAQHEYKVMGLAPYANEHERQKSYEVFRKILKVDKESLNITWDQKPRDLYFSFLESLEGHRFDGIAAGLQQFVEELLVEWMKVVVDRIGRKVSEGYDRQICFAGGVAQNMKAGMKMAQVAPGGFHVLPATGDTSISIGACYHANAISMGRCKPVKLETACLGPVPGIVHRIPSGIHTSHIHTNILPKFVASQLAMGKIIGRCCGPMEFGHRALGNRSILMDPRRIDLVQKLNRVIKKRDFWMPFAPSILDECAGKYLWEPSSRQVTSEFMTMGFETTVQGQKDLAAAIHPSDKTVRPQIVYQGANTDYYDILWEFYDMTGVGGLLNTSFNLHGESIVCTTDDAMDVFQRSELDAVLINNTWISRY